MPITITRSAARFLVVAVAGAGALATLAGCDLFGVINCSDDTSCPDNLPFCVEGACSADEDGGRNGRGVDGGCSEDADCDNGLCDIDGVFGTAGACLPPADDDTADCASDPDVQGQPRTEAAAPVIFHIDAPYVGDGCYGPVELDWFQREPQPVTSAFFELVVGGANLTQSVSATGDNTHLALGTLCGAQLGSRAGLLMNLGGNSNVACLPVAQDAAP